MSLYRDNAKPPAERVLADAPPSPIVADPERPEPWSFKSREQFPEFMSMWGLTSVGVERAAILAVPELRATDLGDGSRVRPYPSAALNRSRT